MEVRIGIGIILGNGLIIEISRLLLKTVLVPCPSLHQAIIGPSTVIGLTGNFFEPVKVLRRLFPSLLLFTNLNKKIESPSIFPVKFEDSIGALPGTIKAARFSIIQSETGEDFHFHLVWKFSAEREGSMNLDGLLNLPPLPKNIAQFQVSTDIFSIFPDQLPQLLKCTIAVAIEKCFQAAGINQADLKFTYIIVSKRINTRFFR